MSRLIQAGLTPDYFTYTSFITGHCRRKEFDAAFQVFKEMSQNGCHRNEFSYTQLIYGLCEAKRIGENERYMTTVVLMFVHTQCL